MLEICLVPITNVASQYPGVYIFSSVARMMRPVLNLSAAQVEMIGTFEQVGAFPDATLSECLFVCQSKQQIKIGAFSEEHFVANWLQFSNRSVLIPV